VFFKKKSDAERARSFKLEAFITFLAISDQLKACSRVSQTHVTK